jgi:hypothetical protein
MIRLLVLFALLLAADDAIATPAITVDCVIYPNSQAILAECDHMSGSYQGGCSQFLAFSNSHWSSRDYPGRGGPALGLVGSCNVPSHETTRGPTTYVVDGLRFTAIKQLLDDEALVDLFAARDPLMAPFDTLGSSQWGGEWNCDDTRNGGLDPHKGAYFIFNPVQSMTRPDDGALLAFASWDFVSDPFHRPAYLDAYMAVRDGFLSLGLDYNNPYSGSTPERPESVINAWTKRWAIMDNMAREMLGDPRPLAGRAVAEYYLREYGHGTDPGAIGLWVFESSALNLAINHWFDMTVDCVTGWCDPYVMFSDTDVATDPTSWGAIKALYRLPRRTIEPAQNGELPPDPFDLPGGTW